MFVDVVVEKEMFHFVFKEITQGVAVKRATDAVLTNACE
jgi:hypothetical protein